MALGTPRTGCAFCVRPTGKVDNNNTGNTENY